MIQYGLHDIYKQYIRLEFMIDCFPLRPGKGVRPLQREHQGSEVAQ